MAQNKLTHGELRIIVGKVSLGDLFERWSFHVQDKGDGFLVKLVFLAKDSTTEAPEWQHCRKWYVSPYSTPTEVVEALYKATWIAMLHEVREKFHYKGHSVFNPHFDIEARVQMCEQQSFDVREPI